MIPDRRFPRKGALKPTRGPLLYVRSSLSHHFCLCVAVFQHLLLQRNTFPFLNSSGEQLPTNSPRLATTVLSFVSLLATLSWTYQSTADDIDHLSVTNSTLPAINPHGNLSEHPVDGAPLSSDWLVNSVPLRRLKCFKMTDRQSQEIPPQCVFFPLSQ